MRGPHCLPQVSFPLIYLLGIAQQELSLKDTVKVRSGKTYVGLFNMVTRSRTWQENKEEFSAGKSLILVFLFIRLMNVLLCLNPDKSFYDSSCLQLTSLQLTWPAVYQWILTVYIPKPLIWKLTAAHILVWKSHGTYRFIGSI